MTTPYLSVFGLLYKDKLTTFIEQNIADTASVGTWTFAIYLFTWNFVSETLKLYRMIKNNEDINLGH